MCGICGIYNFNGEHVEESYLNRMRDCIKHRGPDGKGSFISKNLGLGHRRLSIIDLSENGKQPMFNEENNVALTFNGEIYNFKEVRKKLEKKGHRFHSNTDSEVLVHGYEEWGEGIVKHVDGMFAYAIWDAKKKQLFIARDRVGVKQVYFYFDKEKFLFASEIKAILEDPAIKRGVNREALRDYLNYRYVQAPKTIFKGIYKLLPGHYILIKNNKVIIKKYWDFPKFSEHNPADENIMRKLILDSVKKMMVADVPIGVFLSGGLDSSTLTAFMSKLSEEPVKTYTVYFNQPNDELKYANQMVEMYNTDHHEILVDQNNTKILPEIIWSMDEPLADPAIVPTYSMCRETAKNVKVVLSGEGGDEVFAGYPRVVYTQKLELLKKVIPNIAKKKIIPAVSNIASNFLSGDKKKTMQLAGEISHELDEPKKAYQYLMFYPFVSNEVETILAKNGIKKGFGKTVYDFYMNKPGNMTNNALLFDFKSWLPDDLLLKMDKMSMAHSLEARVPFLDTNLITFSQGLPLNEKIGRNLFKKAVAPYLPKDILTRKKQGFRVPISSWFNGEFFDKSKVLLDNLKNRPYFNSGEINKIIANPKKIRADHKLWTLLNFEIWHRIYIDKIPLKNIRKEL